eukprot:Skav218007  [mRNA]  locus=scaffold2344:124742:129438:- [translate_table: standard]
MRLYINEKPQQRKNRSGKNGSVCLSAEWQPLVKKSEVHHSGIIDVGVYSAMNVPNLGPYAKFWISATCTELMPCFTSEPQTSEQQYSAKVHDRAEVDDGDVPLLHRLKEKKDILQLGPSWRKKGFSHREICEADSAELTLTVMAQGADQPKPVELGSFTRHMSEVVKSPGLFYTETVRLPKTEILVYFKIHLHDLAEAVPVGMQLL